VAASTPSGNADHPAWLRDNHLFQAWLVLMLAIVFGTCLAAVHVNLSDKIAENKLNESLDRIPGLIWQEGQGGTSVEIIPGRIAVKKKERTRYYPVFQVTDQGQPAGWVLKAAGQGYAGSIELLLGLNPSGSTISGLFVLEQVETPGLGNKITSPTWLNQFIGQGTGESLAVVKGGDTGPGTIDAITGATISSKSVVSIVNRAVSETKGRLAPGPIEFIRNGQP
jgi:electron transport complex protein RnfG